MTNRLSTILADLERESEHHRRQERVQRSADMEAAATAEVLEHPDVTMSHAMGRYLLIDERHIVSFYPATNIVMRSINGERRLEKLELNYEADILDIVVLFVTGGFLK